MGEEGMRVNGHVGEWVCACRCRERVEAMRGPQSCAQAMASRRTCTWRVDGPLTHWVLLSVAGTLTPPSPVTGSIFRGARSLIFSHSSSGSLMRVSSFLQRQGAGRWVVGGLTKDRMPRRLRRGGRAQVVAHSVVLPTCPVASSTRGFRALGATATAAQAHSSSSGRAVRRRTERVPGWAGLDTARGAKTRRGAVRCGAVRAHTRRWGHTPMGAHACTLVVTPSHTINGTHRVVVVASKRPFDTIL